MKILAIIGTFIFLRMIFRKFFFIEKKTSKTSKPSNKRQNDQIIDVEYEELE